MFWGIITALISGTLMSVQGVFNSEVTRQTSIWVAASFVQLTALAVCVIAWFVTGKEGSFAGIMDVRPVYMLSGGIAGAFITFTVIQAVNQLGPAQAVIFIVTMQIVAAYVIELLGLFGVEKVQFDIKKLAGLVLITAGIIIFKHEK